MKNKKDLYFERLENILNTQGFCIEKGRGGYKIVKSIAGPEGEAMMTGHDKERLLLKWFKL